MKQSVAASLVILILLLLVVPTKGGDPAPRNFTELQTAIEKVLKETNTPGMGIAIVSSEKTEWVAGLGWADVAAKKPATAQTLFRIFSTSKGFAALAALKLQEEGKLKLNDTLKQCVPDLYFENPWESTDPVRLVHLMEHTAGFPDMSSAELSANDPKPSTLDQALAFAPKNRVVQWRPGSRAAYSNISPALLAAVIEKVTGQRFEDYVQENFFVPLGMNTASYFLTPTVEKNLATGYAPDGRRTFPYYHILYRPAGAISASAEDMANYVRFYLQRGSLDGRRLLQPASIERMEIPRTLPAAQLCEFAGYGLYNYASFEDGHEFHGHTGGWVSGLADMAYCPSLGRGYALMINSGNGGALWQIKQLIRKYLIQDLKSPDLPPIVAIPPELQKAYSGYYSNISVANGGARQPAEYSSTLKRIRFDGQGMQMLPVLSGWPERWVGMSQNIFRRDNSPKPALVFITDEKGHELLQFSEAEQFATMKKIPTFAVWFPLGGTACALLAMLSSLLLAVVWGVRKLFGKLPAPGPLSVRAVPLLASILFLGIPAILAITMANEDILLLGKPNGRTLGIFILTIAFPLAAFLSAFLVWRHRKAPMNRIAYWHSATVTLGLLFMTGFLAYWGLIGLRTWA